MAVGNPADLWSQLTAIGPSGFPYVPSSYMIFSLLTNSEGVSNAMAGVDVTSGTKQTFAYTCPSGHNAAIERVNFEVIDGGIEPPKFAGITAFPIGLVIEHLDSTVGSREVLKDFTDGLFIKTNADWAFIAEPQAVEVQGAGDDFLDVRWKINDAGSPLHLLDGEQIAFSFQDSTTGITQMNAMVQGLVYPNQ